MNSFLKKIGIVIICLALVAIISTPSFGQFEQKITVNASCAVVYPDMVEEFSDFGLGFGIDGGIMFNLNRTFSLYGDARFYYLFGSSSNEEAYLDNMAFGLGAKVNLLPAKRLNPYLFAEANINFVWSEVYYFASGDMQGGSDFAGTLGGLGGVGLDFKLNENLSLFVQTGTYYTYWDDRLNLYSQVGIRLNMIKSKTI
ncbi:MAG: outer membrane beta-barrel protein [Salinivirgaceae bacterium]